PLSPPVSKRSSNSSEKSRGSSDESREAATGNGRSNVSTPINSFDEDIDIYSPSAVEWAIATRFQGDTDMIVNINQTGSSLDPSGRHEPGKKTLTTKIGFDATIPSDVDKRKYDIVKYKTVNLHDYLR
ncbi:MAG: UbiD family decarboxylase, partial [Thermoplasmatota archaeon]